MTRWFQLEHVDETFLESAQHRFEFTMRLKATPDQVWEGLTADLPFAWCRLLTRAEHTSPNPRGAGSTRMSEVAWGALKFRERYLTWDEDARRLTFLVEEMSVPLAGAFAEDLEVTTDPEGSELRWAFAFDAYPRLSGVVWLGLPGIRALLSSFARDTEKHFGVLPTL